LPGCKDGALKNGSTLQPNLNGRLREAAVVFQSAARTILAN
jgi:hypothetical protein